METHNGSGMWEHNTTVFAYELVWRAAQSALQAASVRSPKIRKHHLAIQSFLCAFIAFEGFVNFAGEEIAPDAWRNERVFFNGRNGYRGIVGKVDFLLSKFPEGEQIKRGPHYASFLGLKNDRDFLAHMKVERRRETSRAGSPSFSSRLDAIQTPRAAANALRALKGLAELMRVEGLKVINEDYAISHLNYPAFEGPLGTSSGQGPLS